MYYHLFDDGQKQPSRLATRQLVWIFYAKKYRRLFCRLALGFVILFLVSILTGITVFDYQHNNIVFEYLAAEDDFAILSATFYRTSKSFANNTVVLLFNAHQVFQMKHSHLVVISSNDTLSETTSLQVRPVVGQVPFYCKWVPYIAVGQLVANANWMEFNERVDGINVEMREPYRESRGVVSCFSPMFLNDNWQLLLLTAEVYSHYGAFLQFYVRSMLSPLLDLLRTYKNARITPWPGVELGKERASSASFDPNIELEFRNQASAMTDCLLMYKEAAEYIMFPDPDDVIIPRTGSSYLEEFNWVFAQFPLAATVAYNMTQMQLISTYNPREYSPADVIRTLRFRGDHRWGKLVVKPERVDSVWIHQSYSVRPGFQQLALPIGNNSALHLRFWRFQPDRPVSKIAKYNPEGMADGGDPLVREGLDRIEEQFNRRREEHNELYQQLPAYSVYFPLLEKCYDRIFYNGQQHSQCKGPEMCEIPRFPGIRCTNVAYRYETFSKKSPFYIHLLQDYKFVESDKGCTL